MWYAQMTDIPINVFRSSYLGHVVEHPAIGTLKAKPTTPT